MLPGTGMRRRHRQEKPVFAGQSAGTRAILGLSDSPGLLASDRRADGLATEALNLYLDVPRRHCRARRRVALGLAARHSVVDQLIFTITRPVLNSGPVVTK